ncbi:MAG: hypothetical protein HYT87_19475 [Nitrospirae bacterium]|nr:hypothetical protein [Nitrospirota bacterium]
MARRSFALPILFTLLFSLFTSSCGTATFIAEEKVVKPIEPPNPNVTIQTGDHAHTFPKTFIGYADLLSQPDRAGWEKAREYFRGAQNDPNVDPGAATYGEFATDFLITLQDLNELTSAMLKLFGMEGAPPRDAILAAPPSSPMFAPPFPVGARRHAAGEISHGVLEDLFNVYLLNAVARSIPKLESVLHSEDFVFPAKSVTLGFSAAGVSAAGEFVGYHNKAVALYLRDLLYLIGMASDAVISLRLNSVNLIKQMTAGLDMSELLENFFEGEGAKQTTRLLNSDPTFLTFFPEHLSQARDLLFAYLLSSSINETVPVDNPGHYSDSFMAFLDAENYMNVRSTGSSSSSSGVYRLGKVEPSPTAARSTENLRLHLTNPKQYPYVNAADVFGPLLNNVSAGFNSIATQAVLSSLTSDTGAAANVTQAAVTNLLDTVGDMVQFVAGVQLGINRSVFYLDMHQLFKSLENARNYLPAWTRAIGSTDGYFLEEFECGVKAPQNTLKLSCEPGRPLTDSTHFQEWPMDQLGVGIYDIGGISIDDPDFSTAWGDGVPKDGKKSAYVHFLWQDPGFGGAVLVDPTALDWKKYGVTLPQGSTVPCGVKPELQKLSGPPGLCLMNLLSDVLAVGS